MPQTSRAVVVLLAILATILVGWVLKVGASILTPLVIALLLASMLQPLVRRLARWHIPPALTVVALLVVLFVALVQGGMLLQSGVASFLGSDLDLPSSSSSEREPRKPLLPAPEPAAGEEAELGAEGALNGEGEADQEEVTPRPSWEKIKLNLQLRMAESEMPEAAKLLAADALEQMDLGGLARGILGGSIGFIRSVVLIMIYMIFIFAEQAIFRRKILAVAGNRDEEARHVLDTIGRGIQKYLGVKTVVSLATGVFCYFGLVLLQVPYAPLFGLLTFLLNYIPTFGSIIAAIFPTLTVLAIDPAWGTAVIVMAIYLAVNIGLGNFVEPKILGRELNLSPLVIIISVVVWAGLWGVVGAFLAVPLTAALQIVLLSSERTRPIAVMLSSGPPPERRRDRVAAAAEAAEAEAAAEAADGRS